MRTIVPRYLQSEPLIVTVPMTKPYHVMSAHIEVYFDLEGSLTFVLILS